MKRIGIALVVLALAALGASQALARSQATTTVTAKASTERFGETALLWNLSGKAASPNPACKANRKVKVAFIYEKPPSVKESTTTAKNGSFTLAVHLNGSGEQPQEIEFVIPKKTVSGVTCKEGKTTIPAG